MEPTASRVAILPRQDSTRRNPRTGIGCTIHWFRRECDPKRATAKRVAILDPYPIEQRLLLALAQAQGHQVTLYRDADDLLASSDQVSPQIAFVHIRFGQVLRRAADSLRLLPPIVLIDSCGIASRGQEQFVPLGDFTALRFPIGLREFAEAIRRAAR